MKSVSVLALAAAPLVTAWELQWGQNGRYHTSGRNNVFNCQPFQMPGSGYGANPSDYPIKFDPRSQGTSGCCLYLYSTPQCQKLNGGVQYVFCSKTTVNPRRQERIGSYRVNGCKGY